MPKDESPSTTAHDAAFGSNRRAPVRIEAARMESAHVSAQRLTAVREHAPSVGHAEDVGADRCIFGRHARTDERIGAQPAQCVDRDGRPRFDSYSGRRLCGHYVSSLRVHRRVDR